MMEEDEKTRKSHDKKTWSCETLYEHMEMLKFKWFIWIGVLLCSLRKLQNVATFAALM